MQLLQKTNYSTLNYTNMALQVGDKVPEVLGKNQDGKELKFSDFAGKKLVLYFYPKDNTPGCTLEGQDFTRLASEFLAKGVQIVGVSPDTSESHIRFQ